ncbi:hypothetical protein SAMN05518866_113110 [Sphingobium sp. YR768]|jgi:hypothetical protein|nr:hypothetical protein SAMN05518866_113110 [Sphingobium sp. YR768]
MNSMAVIWRYCSSLHLVCAFAISDTFLANVRCPREPPFGVVPLYAGFVPKDGLLKTTLCCHLAEAF